MVIVHNELLEAGEVGDRFQIAAKVYQVFYLRYLVVTDIQLLKFFSGAGSHGLLELVALLERL